MMNFSLFTYKLCVNKCQPAFSGEIVFHDAMKTNKMSSPVAEAVRTAMGPGFEMAAE